MTFKKNSAQVATKQTIVEKCTALGAYEFAFEKISCAITCIVAACKANTPFIIREKEV